MIQYARLITRIVVCREVCVFGFEKFIILVSNTFI